MSYIIEKPIGSFTAVREDGEQIQINIAQEMHARNIRDLEVSGGSSTDPGLKILKTNDGDSVDRISKGVYEMFLNGKAIILTSDDPIAP